MLLRSSCQSWMSGRHQVLVEPIVGAAVLLQRSPAAARAVEEGAADPRQIAVEGQGPCELLRDGNGVGRCLSNARMQ